MCSTTVCVVYALSIQVPEFRHASIGPGSPTLPYIMRTYLGLVFYQICLIVTKLSVLAFYLRVFSSRPTERLLAWFTVAGVIIYGVPLLFMSLFQCYPVAGQWFGRQIQCVDYMPLLVFSACLHTFADVWIIILIFPCISKLDIPRRQKVALSIVLSLSIFVIACSMVRLQLSLHKDFRPTTGIQTSNNMAFFVMTVLECDIAVMCASAPTLRPLIMRLYPRMLHRSTREPQASVNLTAVSYQGYPWTQPSTPMNRSRLATPLNRSRNASLPNINEPAEKSRTGTPMNRSRNGSMLNIHAPMIRSRSGSLANLRVPRPPMPTFTSSHRTPTNLSLKSFMSSKTARCKTIDRSESRPILAQRDDDLESRRTSTGFDDQHSTYSQEKQQPKLGSEPVNTIGIAIGWNQSEESLVMGEHDPASPTRWSNTPEGSRTSRDGKDPEKQEASEN